MTSDPIGPDLNSFSLREVLYVASMGPSNWVTPLSPAMEGGAFIRSDLS